MADLGVGGVTNFEANNEQSNEQGGQKFLNGRPYNGVRPPQKSFDKSRL